MVTGETAESLLEIVMESEIILTMICFLFFHFFSLSVHGIVDHGVDTAVGHSQPVEGQEHVGGVPGLHDGGVEEGVHEVDMVWEPANRKYSSHCTKHLHNLNRSICEHILCLLS